MPQKFAHGEHSRKGQVRYLRDDCGALRSHTANMSKPATDQWFLKEWRKARGMSQDKLAEAAETSKGYISDLERGERPYNSRLAEKLAEALGISVRDLLTVNPESPKAGELMAPIIGRVGADNEGTVFLASGQARPDYAPIPPGGSAKAVALDVAGHSMRGVADEGALIYFEDQRTPPTPDMLGHVVVLETEDGRVLVKRLLRGSEKGVWDLESLSGPTLPDVRIRWAAHITAIIPPHQARKILLGGAEAA